MRHICILFSVSRSETFIMLYVFFNGHTIKISREIKTHICCGKIGVLPWHIFITASRSQQGHSKQAFKYTSCIHSSSVISFGFTRKKKSLYVHFKTSAGKMGSWEHAHHPEFKSSWGNDRTEMQEANAQSPYWVGLV